MIKHILHHSSFSRFLATARVSTLKTDKFTLMIVGEFLAEDLTILAGSPYL